MVLYWVVVRGYIVDLERVGYCFFLGRSSIWKVRVGFRVLDENRGGSNWEVVEKDGGFCVLELGLEEFWVSLNV